MYQSYSLATTQPRERFDCFHGIVDGVFCRMTLDIDRAARATFDASLESTDLGQVQLVRVATPPLSVRRLPQDIARIDDPPYLVKFQRTGESLWTQRGRDVHVRPGDFVVCSTAEPYALRFRGLLRHARARHPSIHHAPAHTRPGPVPGRADGGGRCGLRSAEQLRVPGHGPDEPAWPRR